MNAAQIHLALTHVPVILSIAGLVILIIGMANKNGTLLKTAFAILLIAGLFAVPVYLTGDGTEELVEHLPGVSEPIIERHEEMGKNAFTTALLAALLSAMGLLFFNHKSFSRLLRPLILVVALIAAGVMTYTAHLGGQVRHTELRNQTTFTQESGTKPPPTPKETAEED